MPKVLFSNSFKFIIQDYSCNLTPNQLEMTCFLTNSLFSCENVTFLRYFSLFLSNCQQEHDSFSSQSVST